MNQPSKHILYITPGFAKAESDTSSVTYFLNFLKELKQKNPNWIVTIITLDYPFEQNKYTWYGSTVYAFGLHQKSKFIKLYTATKVARLVKSIHHETPIDLIHTLWLKQASLLGQYIAKRHHLPIIMTAMGMELIGNNPYLRWIDTKYAQIAYVSKRQYSLSKQNLLTKSPMIIPWGVRPQKMTSQNKDIDILFVGYLNKNKNLQLALHVIRKLVLIFQDLKVVVVGDYFNVDVWRSASKQMNLEHNVSFTGMINNDEVIHLMKSSKMLLHTSDYESLGYAMLEALSCGAFVVSREVGIAVESELWKIAKSDADFSRIITSILSNYEVPEAEVNIDIESTIEAYTKLYNI